MKSVSIQRAYVPMETPLPHDEGGTLTSSPVLQQSQEAGLHLSPTRTGPWTQRPPRHMTPAQNDLASFLQLKLGRSWHFAELFL